MTTYDYVESNVVSIVVNAVSGQANLTLIAPITTVYEDTAAVFQGTLTGIYGPIVVEGGVPIDLFYNDPVHFPGQDWIWMTTVYTDPATGNYTASLTFPHPANVTVKASWNGGTIPD